MKEEKWWIVENHEPTAFNGWKYEPKAKGGSIRGFTSHQSRVIGLRHIPASGGSPNSAVSVSPSSNTRLDSSGSSPLALHCWGLFFHPLGFLFFLFFPCQMSTVLLGTVVVLDTRNSMGFSSDPGPGWFTVGPGSITTKQVRQTSLGQVRIALLNSYCCVARLALFLVAALPLRQLFTPGSSVTISPPPKRPKQSRSATAPS